MASAILTLFLIILLFIGAIFFYGVLIYNKLVRLKNHFENAFAQIDVQLKRRYDLIPNLVETAKGYLKHERETLEAVIAARNSAVQGLKRLASNLGDPGAASALAGAEGNLMGALGRLNMVVEAYPDLKANENMMALNEELTSTENKVAFSRQAYNDFVTAYNIYRQGFPVIVIAPILGHRRDIPMLDFGDREQLEKAPQVAF